ncbi:MAG: FliA/WhiG family RNA polymerase sigma factor [Acidobacteria bacterium]|nr:FliA/WhiG family RNA polymerase sigma factor [Acidobacteriota bacterium]
MKTGAHSILAALPAANEAVAERERLILEHLPQVKLIAGRIHDKLPHCVALEDLISAGIIGLITAIDKFNPGRNVKLKTYAEYKIRGAILDSLRDLDWAPRNKRRKAKLIEAAILMAEKKHNQTPVEEEIAEQLGISLSEYHEWLVEVQAVNLAQLEQAGNGDRPSVDVLRFLSDSEEHWPSRLLERAELEKLITRALDRMPRLERTILTLYYYEELMLKQIAEILKIHETRVSQLKSQAILRLRTYLKSRWPS